MMMRMMAITMSTKINHRRKRRRDIVCRSINDIIKEEEEEEDSGYEYKTNNTTTNDIDNGKDNKGDDEGYGSWSEGNWCWVLPLPPAVVYEIETAGPSTATTRPWRVVRNRNSSRQQSYEEDGGKCNNDDYNAADDDVSSANSKTRKGKIMRYTKLQNERWDEMFQRLVAYKKEHKSINVPRSYAADPKLGNWVKGQRKYYAKKEISVKRTNRLDSIGFVWKIKEEWEEMYQRLVSYKKKHTTTNVPWNHQGRLKLGQWVRDQRRYYNNKQLSIERINRLDSIGFVWDPFDAKWMEMYNRLVEYKKQNKSTRVPGRYTEDPPLGKWVCMQRITFKNGKLSDKRLELLKSINFVWNGRDFSYR